MKESWWDPWWNAGFSLQAKKEDIAKKLTRSGADKKQIMVPCLNHAIWFFGCSVYSAFIWCTQSEHSFVVLSKCTSGSYSYLLTSPCAYDMINRTDNKDATKTLVVASKPFWTCKQRLHVTFGNKFQVCIMTINVIQRYFAAWLTTGWAGWDWLWASRKFPSGWAQVLFVFAPWLIPFTLHEIWHLTQALCREVLMGQMQSMIDCLAQVSPVGNPQVTSKHTHYTRHSCHLCVMCYTARATMCAVQFRTNNLSQLFLLSQAYVTC